MPARVRKMMDRPMSILILSFSFFHQYFLEFIKDFEYFKNFFKEHLILLSAGCIRGISDAPTRFQQGVGLTD
jgi:hypothetical protein